MIIGMRIIRTMIVKNYLFDYQITLNVKTLNVYPLKLKTLVKMEKN